MTSILKILLLNVLFYHFLTLYTEVFSRCVSIDTLLLDINKPTNDSSHIAQYISSTMCYRGQHSTVVSPGNTGQQVDRSINPAPGA